MENVYRGTNTVQPINEKGVIYCTPLDELIALKESEAEFKKLLDAMKAREKELIPIVMKDGDIILNDKRKLVTKSRNSSSINQKAFKMLYAEEYMKLARDGELDVKIDQVKAVLPADEIDGIVTYTRSEWVELQELK